MNNYYQLHRASLLQRRSKRLWERCRFCSLSSQLWQTYHSSQRLFFERWYFKPLPIPQVLEEGDIDDDKKLSINEFTHVINKAPDFLTTFNIRI